MPSFKSLPAIFFLVSAIVFGFAAGLIVNNIPYLRLDTKVGISDIASILLTITVAAILSPLTTNRRTIKDFLINEVKDCINFLNSIKKEIDEAAIKGSSEKADKLRINSMIRDLGIRIDSLNEQLNLSYKRKSKGLQQKLTDMSNEYWEAMTSGQLMADGFKFDATYVSLHDKNYKKLLTTLKLGIPTINDF